jgi:P2-related tail formation protein
MASMACPHAFLMLLLLKNMSVKSSEAGVSRWHEGQSRAEKSAFIQAKARNQVAHGKVSAVRPWPVVHPIERRSRVVSSVSQEN